MFVAFVVAKDGQKETEAHVEDLPNEAVPRLACGEGEGVEGRARR